MNRIGVIGGNGVAATNKLCQLIETQLTRDGAFRDAHHPEMIIWQATQAPSRSMFLEGRGPSFVEEYVEVGSRLATAGASVLAMCCNTAHHSIDELRARIGLPFIDLIEEVAKKVAVSNARTVGLVASDGCLSGKVYETTFARICPEVSFMYPSAELQRDVTRGICNIKNSSRFLGADNPERPSRIFGSVNDFLIESGADLVVMGCTDIRVDYAREGTIDSLETLAEAIISRCSNGK